MSKTSNTKKAPKRTTETTETTEATKTSKPAKAPWSPSPAVQAAFDAIAALDPFDKKGIGQVVVHAIEMRSNAKSIREAAAMEANADNA